ncbi:MAG TPA: hypothetical protein VFI06_00620 [Chitinophagaceae bacterium]|nr:hypothetical protein [Chitinophagaceae bacterium]
MKNVTKKTEHPAMYNGPKKTVKRLTKFLAIVMVFFIICGRAQGQDTTKKVRPASKSTVTLKEIEGKEKQFKVDTTKRGNFNDADNKLPRNLPVPPGARQKTYKVPPVDTTANKSLKKNESATSTLFPALGDNNTTIPPDIGAAAGPNHLMIALNSEVRIQNKTGTTLSTVSLGNFFSTLAGVSGVFDPKVLYDPFAQRWMITAPCNRRTATSSICLGISATNDPTGTWDLYLFDADGTNTNWFDYPSIGFNRNWIVVTGNMFSNAADAFAGEMVFMFDKAATYAGSPTATTNLATGVGGTIVPAITLDNTINNMNLVSNWNGSSGGSGFLRLFTITGTASAPVFAATSFFPGVTQPWNSNPPTNFAPQNTVANLIANGDSRIQNAVFRGGSLWCTQSAFLPDVTPTHSAVQWWQINPATGTVQQFGRVEDVTAATFFAFPSIAVNAYNDVYLGYSSFSATQFASSNSSFRLHTDAVNTMQPTVRFKAGLAKYFKTFGLTANRWGDYSSTCVDPNDFTMWTAQEYAEAPVSGSDRWGTEWSNVTPPVPDLYLKDRTDDLGAEPNPSTLPMWQSEEIWVRKAQDPTHAFAHLTEDAEYRTGTSNPNYVYVEVRNRGGVATAGTEQLILYWAKASSGLSWMSPWTGGVYFDPGPNTMLMGNVINTQTLPAIAAGSSTIVEFAWNPPNPVVYTGVLAADQNHFCLLARIVTSAGMTFPETSDLYGNVQKNNNIAWKNISVYDMLPGTSAPEAYTTIANLSDQKMIIKLKFSAADAEGNNVLLTKGSLKLTVNGKLKDILLKNRLTGEGFKDQGNGIINITTEDGYLDNIPLEPKDFGTIKIEFVPNNAEEKFTGYAITVTQIDNTGGNDHIIGGQTAVFGKVKGFGTSTGKTQMGGTGFGLWWHWLLIILGVLLILWLLLRRKK